MNVLMLGNSFTFYNDMPNILSMMLNEKVESITRGGAYLYQFLDSADELNVKLLEALAQKKWDYIILQEQSNTPALKRDIFQNSVNELCKLIRQNGAKPLLYATWAYRDGTEKLASTGLTFIEMDQALYASYHDAAEANGTLIADVGKAFCAIRPFADPYFRDDYHPSWSGSVVAALTIANVILRDAKQE